jgi:hypothetical protein
MSTPPLTPAGTESAERVGSRRAEQVDSHEKTTPRPDIITPQESTHEPTKEGVFPLAVPSSLRPSTAGEVMPRPRSADGRSERLAVGENHRKSMFVVGPSGGSPGSSVAPSREASPSRASAASESYSRRALPAGDAHDPYAANRRQAQQGIDSRFVFSRKKKHASPSSSTVSLARPSQDKRHSTIFTGHGPSRKDDLQHEEQSHSRQSSMADLKRFFKLGQSKMKRSASPAV